MKIVGYERVKYYSEKDFSCGFELEKAEIVLRNFSEDSKYEDINDIIEFYNIKCYFDNEIYLQTWDEIQIHNYSIIAKKFNKAIGVFFYQVNDDNVIEYLGKVSADYKKSFWEIIERFNVYKRISDDKIICLIENCPEELRNILKYKKIVERFSDKVVLSLKSNYVFAELLLEHYLVRHDVNSPKIYIPTNLSMEDKRGILQHYIAWSEANSNYLQLIATLKKCDDFVTDDRIRYAALKKYEEMREQIKNHPNAFYYTYGAEIEFYCDEDITSACVEEKDGRIIKCKYNTEWFKNNLDYATILNNFIYVFGFVDQQCRCRFLSNPRRLGLFEDLFGVKGTKDYTIGIDYNLRSMKSSGQMLACVEQLKINKIEIEKVFKWFFEEYLYNEFGVKGFKYFTPSENASWLEKILILITQVDAIIKQFRYYREDGAVNRDLFEFSSNQYRLSDTPSLIPEKYLYYESEKMNRALHLLFSSQSLLRSVKKVDEKYLKFPLLVTYENIKVEDFPEYSKADVKWLLDNDFAYLNDEGYIKVDVLTAVFLNDLYENGVVLYDYYKSASEKLKIKITQWIRDGDISVEGTLFTKQEQDFIDYMLNVQQFNNGPELRNKYAHGTFSLDEKVHKQDYIELLKIMVLIIIKINDDFCVKFPLKIE